MTLGILSDTHGALDSRIFSVFAGVDHILHAGDIGDPDILVELRALAPVTAVYGNVDGFDIRRSLHGREFLMVDHTTVEIRHMASPHTETKSDILIAGHTHEPFIHQQNGLLFINPGSASRPRGREDATVVLLSLETDQTMTVRLISLTHGEEVWRNAFGSTPTLTERRTGGESA
jgi:hypothetical protein